MLYRWVGCLPNPVSFLLGHPESLPWLLVLDDGLWVEITYVIFRPMWLRSRSTFFTLSPSASLMHSPLKPRRRGKDIDERKLGPWMTDLKEGHRSRMISLDYSVLSHRNLRLHITSSCFSLTNKLIKESPSWVYKHVWDKN